MRLMTLPLFVLAAFAVAPLCPAAPGNLLESLPLKVAASGGAVDGWQLQTNRKSPVRVTAAEDGKAVRIAPESGEMSVSLYAPATRIPAGSMVLASVRAKGDGELVLYATAADWKKDAVWGATHCAGAGSKLSGEWRTYSFAFPAPEPGRSVRFRVDARGSSPVELADAELTVHSGAAGLLEKLPLDGWERNLNRKGEVAFSAAEQEAGIRLAPSSGGPMQLSLYAPEMRFPSASVLTFRVRAKGEGTLRLYLTAADWKKDAVWNATHQGSAEFKLGGDWQTYHFTCPAPEPGRQVRLRIDVAGKGPVELAAPEIQVQSEEDAAAEAAKKKERQQPGLIFETATDGKVLRVTPETRLDFPLPAQLDLSRGSLSFRFKLDEDLWFEPLYRGFWEFAGTRLNSRFAHARIHFGSSYVGLSQRIAGNEWHQLTYVWNADDGFRLYLDGRIAFLDAAPLSREKADLLAFGKTAKEPGFAGSVADVRLYDRELSDAAVGELYNRLRPMTPYPLDYAAVAGKKQTFRIGFDNHSPAPVTKRYRATVTECGDGGKLLFDDIVPVAAEPGRHTRAEIAFTPEKTGDCILTLTDTETGDRLSFRLAILDSVPVGDAMKPGPVKRKLVAEIDCTVPPDPAGYRDDGKSRVVESPAGRYRETAGNVLNSGFAYRFSVPNPGRPHWLEFEYPDDRARTFYCALGAMRGGSIAAPFLDACGVITGGNFPLSDAMQTKRLFFVPDADEYGVVFGSHRNPNGESGPGVAKIRLYELEGDLPKLDLDAEGRRIMIWNEDPTMTAYTWFKQFRWNAETANFDFWRDKLRRMVEYTRYIGWSEWNMLGYDYLGDNTSGDRRLVSSSYGAAGGFLPGHLDMLAVTAEREKIPFYLSLNHLSGWKNGPAGLALEAGREAMSRDFFDAIARGEEAPELFSADNKLAEVRHRALNPIHPTVRAALRRMFRAYADKFGRYDMFRGLDYQASEPLHFSSSKFGYGDYTAALFRKETGVPLPDFRGVRRFGERYDWLRKNAWEKWLDWRCAKVAGLVEELVGELDGRELILRVTLARLDGLAPSLERGELPDLKALYREQGLDLDMLAAIPQVTVMPDFRPNYSRTAGRKADERTLEFSDNLAALWQNPAIDSAQITQHSNLEIYNSIAQMPIRNLWNNNMFVSFSTPLPPGRRALENFAWLLANADPQRINYGWWGNPEAGEEEVFRDFYRAYSRIPRRDFAKLPGGNDPVAARQSGEVIYLVNQCMYPAEITLSGAEPFRLTDLVTGENIGAEKIEVAPFGLRVFRQDRPVPVTQIVQTPPEALRAGVADRLARITRPNPASRRAEALFRAGRYTAASYALEHRSLADQLQREPFGFTLTFLPAVSALAATVENRQSTELTGELIPPEGKPLPFRLPPGKSRTFELLRLAEAPAEGALLQFEAALRTGGKTVTRTLRFQPFRAPRGTFSEPDGTLNTWKAARFFPLDSRNSGQRQAGLPVEARNHFKAAFAARWSPEGLSLAIRVEDRDFLPPRSAEKMWEHDSVVLYFDQLNNARAGISGYDGDDVPFRIGLVDGKPTVRRGEPPVPDDAVKCAIVHRDGQTVYELFLPKAVLPSVRFEPGGGCGFSLEVINRFADGKRGVLSPHPEAPHLTPYVWSDLLFEGGE